MKKKTSKASLVLLAVIALSLIIVPAAIAITWGQPDTKHTNVGAIVVYIPDYKPYQLCSGTLIAPDVFLTAGHCTESLANLLLYFGLDVDDVYVTFDQDALNQAEWRSVADFQTHPDYYWGPQSNPHDVGVLILAESATGIEPATLPDEGFLDDMKKAHKLKKAKFTVVGYGGTLDWPPPVISYEDQRQYAESEYRALLKSWLRLSQNHATGDGGTSYGDSGGPAFWTEPGGAEKLVGITSWGDSQTVATGFYYRVDTTDTLDFIASVLD